ncbi:unnamed protein product, partial [Ectocarpus sp. 12 AP-2014]
ASSLRHGRSQLQERPGGCGRRSVREGERAQPQAGPDGSGSDSTLGMTSLDETVKLPLTKHPHPDTGEADVHRLRHAGASERHLQATPPKGPQQCGTPARLRGTVRGAQG